MRQRLILIILLLAFSSQGVVAKPCTEAWRVLKWGSGAGALLLAGALGFIKLGLPVVERHQYGDSPPAFPKRENLCCACEWMPFHGCGAHSVLTCASAIEGPFRMTECTYQGGRCQSRFELACRQWLASDEQKGCRKSVSFTFTNDHSKIYEGMDKQGCQAMRYSYQGHGIHHDDHSDLAEKVEALLNKVPDGIRDVEIDENACSMFNDTDVTVAALRKFGGQNFRLRSVKISGNQTAVRDGLQGRTLGDTRVEFIVDKSGVNLRFSPCHTAGLRCVQHDQTAQCQTDDRVAEEACCCEGANNDRVCRWRRVGGC